MITIKDVAKLAGVSISTVSIVLNGTRKLSPATEAKVRKAIETLQYHPNQYARSLVTKHKKVVGVIRIVDEERDDHSQDLYASTVDTYLQDMLWNIEEVIRLHGSSMVLGWYDALAPEQIPSILDPSRVDGIVCVGSFISAQLIAAVKRSGLAAVLVGARDAAFDFVDADVERAFQLSASSMLQRGRRRLLLLNGPGNSQSSQRREAGFLQAVAMAGAEGRTCNCQFSGKSAEEVCLGMIPTFKPDAIIAGADCMAVGALNAMRRSPSWDTRMGFWRSTASRRCRRCASTRGGSAPRGRCCSSTASAIPPRPPSRRSWSRNCSSAARPIDRSACFFLVKTTCLAYNK